MPIELGSFNVIIGDETLMVQSNRSDGYASIVASEQRAELCGRIGTLEGDNMRLRGMLGHAIWFDQRTRVFMDLMNRVCKPYLDKFVIVFIDDIFTYSRRNEEYGEHHRLISKFLKNKELYAKFSKREFWLPKVQFLSHVVDSQDIYGDSAKIESIKD
ncbi:hypothetical protein Tco_1102691 [Tanacetum coccineum]